MYIIFVFQKCVKRDLNLQNNHVKAESSSDFERLEEELNELENEEAELMKKQISLKESREILENENDQILQYKVDQLIDDENYLNREIEKTDLEIREVHKSEEEIIKQIYRSMKDIFKIKNELRQKILKKSQVEVLKSNKSNSQKYIIEKVEKYKLSTEKELNMLNIRLSRYKEEIKRNTQNPAEGVILETKNTLLKELREIEDILDSISQKSDYNCIDNRKRRYGVVLQFIEQLYTKLKQLNIKEKSLDELKELLDSNNQFLQNFS